MAVRKINLDDDAEKALATVIAETGLTVSQVVNIALKIYADDDEFACAVNEIQAENADYGDPPLLDGESEKTLFEIRERTGASNLLAIKRGLAIYADQMEFYTPRRPRAYEAYREIMRRNYGDTERASDDQDADGEMATEWAKADAGEIIRAKFKRELNRELHPR